MLAKRGPPTGKARNALAFRVGKVRLRHRLFLSPRHCVDDTQDGEHPDRDHEDPDGGPALACSRDGACAGVRRRNRAFAYRRYRTSRVVSAEELEEDQDFSDAREPEDRRS